MGSTPNSPPTAHASEPGADREMWLKEAAFVLEWEKLQDSRKSGRQLWSSPAFLTILGALLGLIATGVVNFLETASAARLERQKFESGLIGKAFETGDQEQAAKYLSFLATTRIIRDDKMNARLAALATRPGDIPVFDRERGASELNARRSPTSRQVTELIITDAQVPSALMAISALQSRGRSGGSYHYLVDSSGVVVPLIPEEWEALHTRGRNANSISIGLAHVSRAVAPGLPWRYAPYSARQIEAVTRLVADVATRHRIPPERIIPKSQIDPSKASDVPEILPRLREAVRAGAPASRDAEFPAAGRPGEKVSDQNVAVNAARREPTPGAVLEILRSNLGAKAASATEETPLSSLTQQCLEPREECLDWVGLVLEWEEQFGIAPPDREWLRVRRVADVVELARSTGTPAPQPR